MRTTIATLSPTLSFTIANAVNADLLINGSFEFGAFVPSHFDNTMLLPSESTTIDGWEIAGNEVQWLSNENPHNLSAYDGQFFIDLTSYNYQGPSGIQQTFVTVPGNLYKVTFSIGSESQYGQPVGVSVSAANQNANFATSGVGVSDYWEQFTWTFGATGAFTTLAFVNLEITPPHAYIGLDNVSVDVVPEASSLILAMTAGAGIVFRRRGKKASGTLLRVSTTCLPAFIVALLFSTAAAQAVTINWATVGNPGNAPDTRYNSISVGAVPHVFRISKYEITAGQYTEFLNAVAKADPNGLYNTNMTSSAGANIVRDGSSPNYSYSVAPDWADRPVNYVNFWDAARFVNWLHNNQPTGPQGPGTTEAGAYVNIGNQATFARQPGAKYWIPTEGEWYKAAYHDKSAGLAASYFDYPTGTNAVPGRDLTETTNPGNNANYFLGSHLIGSPYYRTNVGEFELSASLYGTFDQGGNVWEWNETAVTGSTRGGRGGSFGNASDRPHASYRSDFGHASESSAIGFRVASIPEPGAAALCLTGATALMLRSRRKR